VEGIDSGRRKSDGEDTFFRKGSVSVSDSTSVRNGSKDEEGFIRIRSDDDKGSIWMSKDDEGFFRNGSDGNSSVFLNGSSDDSALFVIGIVGGGATTGGH